MCCVHRSNYLYEVLTVVRIYRIRWAATGLLSYALPIVAIEVISKWNRVGGIYSIASTGQYVALIIGIGSFVSVLWTLVLQETVGYLFYKGQLCFTNRLQERRRHLKRRQLVNHDINSVELDSLSNNFTDAISHAFSRPDVGFSTNGGAFPINSGEEEEEPVQSLSTPKPSLNIEAFMSGALDSQPDLEARTPATSGMNRLALQ